MGNEQGKGSGGTKKIKRKPKKQSVYKPPSGSRG